jgi:SAM-dependent methyltransferase
VVSLDIGCNGGFWSIECFLRGNQIQGIDLSEDAVNSAYSRLRRWGINSSRVSFEKMDVRNLADGKYDQILAFEVLEHIMNDEEVLRQFSLLLKPVGHLLISTPNVDFHPFYGEKVSQIEDGGHVRKGYSFEDLNEKLRKVGLNIIVQDSCGGYFTQKCIEIDRKLHNRFPKKGLWFTFIVHLALKPLTYLDPLKSYPNYSIFVVAEKA